MIVMVVVMARPTPWPEVLAGCCGAAVVEVEAVGENRRRSRDHRRVVPS